MQPRERMLAIVVGFLAVAFAMRYGYAQWNDLYDQRDQKLRAIEKVIADKEMKIARGALARKQIAEWERRSLPPNRELARSLYQRWLLSMVEQEKLAEADVTSQIAPSRKGAYDKLAFTINARGTLDQVVRLLYRFYQADHLHQVRRLSLKSADKPGQLSIAMAVEALSLPGAERGEGLSEEISNRLRHGAPADYAASITKRNLFAEYQPPVPVKPVVVATKPKVEAPPKPPAFDAAKYAIITAILEVNNRRQMWLSVQTTGKTFKLFEGDAFEVGAMRGTIGRIGSREVELNVDGKRRLVALGESLNDAADLPPGDL